ncbi:uncharacterized protein [Oscarella lobularis]|uniref:uncharacterized protein n=1 Tax=Oscarella lobularis TaxID=121494 RepID=UPI00331411B2
MFSIRFAVFLCAICATTQSQARTTDSGSCVFPFKYKGTQYDDCTSEGHDREWCATSVKEDLSYREWDNCHVYVPTTEPTSTEPFFTTNTAEPAERCTTDGSVCVFPFKYKGILYYDCTSKGHDREWCATSVKEDLSYREWGNCLFVCDDCDDCDDSDDSDDNDETVSVCSRHTTNGKRCVPFKYGTNLYSGCTKAGHNREWCATCVKNDSTYSEWDNCEPDDAQCFTHATERRTTKGVLCVPFKYKGTLYNGCTSAGHSKEWCATSVKKDLSYHEWDNCQPLAVDFACQRHTTDGRPCVPFTYKGRLYNGCTKVGHNREWCATSVKSDSTHNKWGNCRHHSAPAATQRRTTNESPCVPFKYKGTLYNGCTSAGHSKEWCATSVKEDLTYKEWDNCRDETVPTCQRRTTDGKLCVPFKYKNQFHRGGCTNAGHSREWCATSVKNDSTYSEWDNCQPADETACSTTATERVTTTGKPCVPFKYKSSLYNGCTRKGHDREWCATSVKKDLSYSEWDNCYFPTTEPTEPFFTTETTELAERRTTDGSVCVFPFKYKGTQYDDCTSEGHDREWCATSVKKDQSYSDWGNCQ